MAKHLGIPGALFVGLGILGMAGMLAVSAICFTGSANPDTRGKGLDMSGVGKTSVGVDNHFPRVISPASESYCRTSSRKSASVKMEMGCPSAISFSTCLYLELFW